MWSLNHPPPSAAPVLQEKFKFHPLMEKDWKKSFASHMRNDPPPLISDPSISDLNRVITFLNADLHSASLETAHAPPQTANPNPWFTSKVKEVILVYRYARIVLRRCRKARKPCDFVFRVMVRKRNRLHRIIAKAKRDWAFHFTSNVEPNKVWSLNNWYKGIRKYKIPLFRIPTVPKLYPIRKKLTFLDLPFFGSPHHPNRCI